MTTVAKTSISLKPQHWEKLKTEKNRSVIINKALELYFEREQWMKKAQQDWMGESIQAGLNDIQNKQVSILNTDGKKRTKKQIMDFLHQHMDE